MNTKRNIKLSPILLLLIYAISIYPTSLFHHHASHKVVYEQATSCERTIYYGEGLTHCGHTDHVSKPNEKCSLCDHTSNVLYTFDFVNIVFFKQSLANQYHDCIKSLVTKHIPFHLNKGPPIV